MAGEQEDGVRFFFGAKRKIMRIVERSANKTNSLVIFLNQLKEYPPRVREI